MAESDQFSGLRDRQRSAIIVNQQAQLAWYGREFDQLRLRNRELKRELKKAQREMISTKRAVRLLVRRASRGLVSRRTEAELASGEAPGKPVESPSPSDAEDTFDEAPELIIDGELIRSSFDADYYATVHELAESAQAWPHYLEHGVPAGAAISEGHDQRIPGWHGDVDTWLLMIRALVFRHGATGLLAKKSEPELEREFQAVVSTLQSCEHGETLSRFRALQALIARYCPDLDPRVEAEQLRGLFQSPPPTRARLPEPPGIARPDGQAASSGMSLSDARSFGREWGVIVAALVLGTDGWADLRKELVNRQPQGLLADIEQQVGSARSSAERDESAPDPGRLRAQVDWSQFGKRAAIDVVGILGALWSADGGPGLAEFREGVKESALAILEADDKVADIARSAEMELTRQLVGPGPVIAELFFGELARDVPADQGRTDVGHLRPGAEWLSENNAGVVESAVARSGWPAAYVVWRPVRALSRETVSDA